MPFSKPPIGILENAPLEIARYLCRTTKRPADTCGTFGFISFLFSYTTRPHSVIPAAEGVFNTTRLVCNWSAGILRLAASKSGHIQSNTAWTGKPNFTRRAGSKVLIKRGAGRTAWVRAAAHSLTALECLAIGKSCCASRIRLNSQEWIINSIRRFGQPAWRNTPSRKIIKI
jgi:hypothetical protein